MAFPSERSAFARRSDAGWLPARLVIALIFAFLLHTSAGTAANAPEAVAGAADSAAPWVSLTDEERAWIGEHPRIRVHNETDWPPFNFAEDGMPRGLSIDIMNLVAAKVGLSVDYVTGPTWAQFMEMMKSDDLDVMLNIVRTPERETFLLYTPPYATNPSAILSRRTTPYGSLEDLAGKTVAVPKGFFYEEILKREHPEITVLPLKDVLAGMKAVSFGKADAAVGKLAVFSHLINQHMMTDLTVSGEVVLGDPSMTLLNMATRKDLPILASILSKGVKAVGWEERRALQDKWLGRASPPAGPSADIPLNDAERAWLTKHQIIRMGTDTAWPPFDYVDAYGNHQGYAADMIALLGKRLGVSFQRVPDRTWAQVVEGTKQRTVDILSVCSHTKDREAFLRFTRPTLMETRVIATRRDGPPVAGLGDLVGHKVAMVEGFSAIKLAKDAFPSLEIVEVKSPLDGLKAVAFGRADGYLGNLGVIGHLIQENGLTSVHVAGPSGLPDQPMSICVRSDWPELVSILDKALGSLSRTEMTALRQKWIPVAMEPSESTQKVVDLTAEEEAWLAAHPVITFGNELDWPPFDFAQNGVARGLSIDTARLAAEKVGITPKFINGFSWAELLERFNAGKIDVLPAVYITPERRKGMAFTSTYAANPSVLVVKTGRTDVQGLDDLKNGTIAAIKGFATADLLRERFPSARLLPVENALDGLKSVAFARADGFVGSLGVIAHLLESTVIPDIQIVGEVWLKTPEETELRMSVLKENTLLRDILQKGLDAITEEERRELRKRWLPIADIRSAMDADARSVFSDTEALTLLAVVLVVVVLLLGLGWIARRTSRADPEWVQQSGKMKTIGLIAVGIFLGIVVLAALYVADRVEREQRARTESMLQTMLGSTQAALNLWVEGNIRHIRSVSDTRWLRLLAEKILRVPRDRKSLLESSYQTDLRTFFADQRTISGDLGFFLISPDNLNLASMRDENVGEINLIALQRPDLLKRVFAGDTLLIPPIRSDIALTKEDAEKPATMFFAAPVRDLNDQIIAAMTLRVDVANDFMRPLQLARTGHTGETYAVSHDGHLLSESRYAADLKALGLLRKDQRAALNLRLADPGGNLTKGYKLPDDITTRPLTHMAAEVAAGRTGTDVEGYRDYRGVKVLGAWMWDPTLNMGLATEVDEDEALATYYEIRDKVFGLLGATVLLALGLTGFSVWLGSSATRSLIKSRDAAEEARLVAEEARFEAEAAEEQIRVKAEEVERFNRLAVGRENRIVELKEMVNALHRDLGKSPPFKVTHEETPPPPMEGDTVENGETLDIAELIDLEELQALLENFCNAVGIASAIIDIEGKVLAAARWQRACTDFHRVNEETCARCIESDTDLSAKLQDGQEFSIYRCKNGLTDAASPIVIGGYHLANVFIGQFLLGEPDESFFREQARSVGFDETDYMAAIGEVPVLAEETLPDILSFLTKFAKLVASLSMERLKAERAGETMQSERIAAMNVAEDAEIARAELDAYKNHLEDLVQERTRELEAASEKLGLALSSMSDGIFLLDRNLDYVMFNDRYKELLGVPGDLIGEGKPVRDVVRFLAERGDYEVEDIDAWVEERMRQIAKAESARVELHIKDGPILELRQSPTTDGGIVVIATDVTDSKRAEAAVAEAEERGRLILESAGEAIFGLDGNGITTFVNPTACTLLDFAPEELIGQPMHPLVHHAYADGTPYPWEKCLMRAAFHDGEIHHVTDEVLWRKDGTSVPVEYTSTPIHKDGELMGAVITCRDITERLKVERELREKMDELEKFSTVAVGRELRMIKLKEEVNALRDRLGQPPEYEIAD